MIIALANIRVFILLGLSMLQCDEKTYSVFDGSDIPSGTRSISLDVDLSVEKMKVMLQRVEESVVKIVINDVPFTLEQYKIICGLSHLESLEIRSEKTVNDYGEFATISPPRRLETLKLSVSGRTDASAAPSKWRWVLSIPTLRSLSLDLESPLTNTETFVHLRDLRHLTLSLNGDISDDTLSGLRRCQSIETLRIVHSDRLSKRNFEDLAAIPNLTKIELMFASKTDHLHLLNDAKRLEWLILSRNFIDSRDFTSLVEVLKCVKIVEN